MVEISAVVDAGYFARRAAEHFRLPGVEVGIEMDDGDGPVGTVNRAQEGKCNGVVATEGDDSWERLAVLGWAFLLCVGSWRTSEDRVVAFLDLGECPGVIVPILSGLFRVQLKGWCLRGNRDITTIQDRCPAVERVGSQRDIIPSTETDLT